MRHKMLIVIVGIIMLFSLIGAGYKLSLSKILKEYDEVCTMYQKNVTVTRWCNDDYYLRPCYTYLNYVSTGQCVEYTLMKKTNVTPFIYSFDWCDEFPESENCSPTIFKNVNYSVIKEISDKYLNSTYYDKSFLWNKTESNVTYKYKELWIGNYNTTSRPINGEI